MDLTSNAPLRRLPARNTYPATRGECAVKKTLSLPVEQGLEMELLAMDPNNCEANPFLKARVTAYLKDLDKSTSALKMQKIDSKTDPQAPLFEDERVTFKKVNAAIKNSSKNVIEQLSKQTIGSSQK